MSSTGTPERKRAKVRHGTASDYRGSEPTRNLNNYRTSHQSHYSDTAVPFTTLLTSIRVTSHEMDSLQSMLNTPPHRRTPNSPDTWTLACKESSVEVREAAREFLSKSSSASLSADDLSEEEYDFSRAPPGVLEEVANIEVAWKAWNWTE